MSTGKAYVPVGDKGPVGFRQSTNLPAVERSRLFLMCIVYLLGCLTVSCTVMALVIYGDEVMENLFISQLVLADETDAGIEEQPYVLQLLSAPQKREANPKIALVWAYDLDSLRNDDRADEQDMFYEDN